MRWQGGSKARVAVIACICGSSFRSFGTQFNSFVVGWPASFFTVVVTTLRACGATSESEASTSFFSFSLVWLLRVEASTCCFFAVTPEFYCARLIQYRDYHAVVCNKKIGLVLVILSCLLEGRIIPGVTPI